MTPLRKKMNRDLELRRFSISTRETYIRAVFGLAKYYMISPDQINTEQLLDYVHFLMMKRKLSCSTVNVATAGLRFFYRETLGRNDLALAIPPRKTPRKLPEILSHDELERLFASTDNRKHRVMLMTAYSGGLRISEVVHLKVTDIDSGRMAIRIQNGKGGKDRYTILSRRLLADIFRANGEIYRENHSLPKSHLKVMRHIEICRTSELGGHLYECDHCGHEHPAYNSCRDRHCPKCQALSKARWLEARNAELLPVTYFHDVFTLPHELNPWVRYNKKVIYDILFQSVSQTLLKFGANPENGIGGKLGFLMVLHSWDQRLLEHHHLHCIIPGGALSFTGKSWIKANPEYLFPVKALSIVYRGKFTDLLEKAFDGGKIVCPDGLDFKQLLARLRQIKWVVYSKPTFAGPEKVLDYLGRYVHRVAISNNRIKKFENGKVTFTYKDRNNGNLKKETTVPAEEFIRRFLLHVLPDGYMRIRYFGFMGNRYKKENISLIRSFFDLPVNREKPEKKKPEELILELTGKNIAKCPKCKTGTMVIRRTIPRSTTNLSRNIINQPKGIDSS